MSAKSALIIGCGYLGVRLARILLSKGMAVTATTRTDENWPILERLGVQAMLFDVGSEDYFLTQFCESGVDEFDVFFMVPTSATTRAFQSGAFARLAAGIQSVPLRRAFLISSTGIYARINEQVVDAGSTVFGREQRSTRIRLIEEQWLDMGKNFFVSRLAGLYGPNRIIGRSKLLSGESIPGDPQAWLNLIHVEDAARFLDESNESAHTRRIELASDARPIRRCDYYNFVANELGAPSVAEFDIDNPRASGSYRCDPASTMARIGWTPRYANFGDGIIDSLAAERADS
jgi:nucleoside-diphosphate-sugar epimerase